MCDEALKLLAVRPTIKKMIPTMCSTVHTLPKRAKLRKSVMAFLAVDVMDVVKAPNSLVMAAEQLELKKPIVENNTMTNILFTTFQVENLIKNEPPASERSFVLKPRKCKK